MITRTAETLPRIEIPFIVKHVRVSAFLLLILSPLAVFGMIYVPSILIVPGDAAATARNIMASESLFRLGIASTLLSQLVGIFWVLVLYQLLKPVNKNMAVLMVILNLLIVPIAMLNELNQFAVLLTIEWCRLPESIHTRPIARSYSPSFSICTTMGLKSQAYSGDFGFFPMGF